MAKNVQVKGVEQVKNFHKNYFKKLEAAALEGMMEGGEIILNKSKELAPKDTTRMIRETDVVKKSNDEVHVRYNMDYSIYVHEDLEKIHPTGQAKFLKIATDEKATEVFKKVAKKAKGIK